MARVEALLGEQVGMHDLGGAPAVVRQRAARDGLQVAEVRTAEPEAERGVRTEPVGGLQRHETAPGAHEGGTGAQQFLEGRLQRAGPGEPFGQFMEGGEVGDPAGEPVLEDGAGCRCGRGLGHGRGDRGCRGGGNRRDSVGGSGDR